MHNLFDNEPASSISWNFKCPKEYPMFEKAWMIHLGKKPYGPSDHPFPWEAAPGGNCNGKQAFNVPTRSSHPWSGLDRIRLCYKCCKKDTCE